MKVKASTMIDKSLWAEIKKLATLSDKPAGRIAEVGLKLLLIIAKTGVPDDLGALLQVQDTELLNTLRELHEAWRSASNI
ncbi:hypothetical protein [Thermofilum sp.]|uniref:hypothetical protein n=1 Tax=Thermofilum sp. TaxID=1961369 RepID=UPI00315F03C1